MNYFCTYCDRGYAARLLCLHESLARHGEPFELVVLCLDDDVAAVIAAVARPGLRALPWPELLAADPAYAAVRPQRTPVEFYFTTTPVLVRHCLQRFTGADRMTYLDADLYFFGPASAVFAVQGDASIGIVPHRFSPALQDRRQYGTFNVAWVSFRRDAAGQACLEWWRERCLEWCHDRVEAGRFADQGYLDEFPRRFEGVAILDHPGINAAPWNMAGCRVSAGPGGIQVNDRPLLFYHFQGIREIVPGWFEPGLRAYHVKLARPLVELIYQPYLQRLVAVQTELHRRHGIAPKFQYSRLNQGRTWRDRWERFKVRWWLPLYGRWSGRLLRIDEPADS